MHEQNYSLQHAIRPFCAAQLFSLHLQLLPGAKLYNQNFSRHANASTHKQTAAIAGKTVTTLSSIRAFPNRLIELSAGGHVLQNVLCLFLLL
eukprot:18422-Heterococcus_DN1.PRE.3